MELPDVPSAAGINFILGVSEGEIVADAEVQKSALAVLVHCVCAPINKVNIFEFEFDFHGIYKIEKKNYIDLNVEFIRYIVATVSRALWINKN